MDLEKLHPELRETFRRVPALPLHNKLLLAILQPLMRMGKKPDSLHGVAIAEHNTGSSTVRVYTPEGELSGAGLLWIHGGGYVIGAPTINDRECALYARDLKMIVVSAGYRLAPKHPFPAGMDDCFAAWQWLLNNAADLGVNPQRIVISGQSAGGGMAAGLVQRIHDGGGIQPAGQALFCPMIDDRTATKTELDALKHKMWTNVNNRGGWRHYLGMAPGSASVPQYAAAARREDLSGLPPAWIGVGDIDLFHDEDTTYARRLRDAGVPCDLDIFPGAPHGFEILAVDASITKQCWDANYRFLRRVLGL